jgi:hypothetical protein
MTRMKSRRNFVVAILALALLLSSSLAIAKYNRNDAFVYISLYHRPERSQSQCACEASDLTRGVRVVRVVPGRFVHVWVGCE